MAAKILVVDDEVQFVEMMANRLKTKGYEVMTANSGAVALEKIKEVRPDLILLDIMMPGIDGHQVLLRLKESEETERIPVMMLTGKKWGEEIQKTIAAGAMDYIVKPFEPAVLFEKIERVLKNGEKNLNR